MQVLLCSVSGDIFPRADSEQERAQLGVQQGPDLRQAYLGSLLGTVLPWVAPPEQALHTAAANSEAELLDACRWGVCHACCDFNRYLWKAWVQQHMLEESTAEVLPICTGLRAVSLCLGISDQLSVTDSSCLQ